MFQKTRLHYIGIQYTDTANKPAGILLQGDKDNYRAILVALQGVTGVPVSVAEKDREFVPVGVKSEVAKGDETAAKTETKVATGTPESTKGVVSVSPEAVGADVSLDGNFIGNAPATLRLEPGKHIITLKLAGYADWTREITVQSGSEVQLKATLVEAQ